MTAPEGSPAALVPSPGPRTFVLELPAGMKLLSLNQRLHYMERNRRTQAIKQAAWAMARAARIPLLDRVFIVVEYQPPDSRHRDADNVGAPSGKAAIDGIVLAGVIEDDESPRYVTGLRYEIGERFPKGRIVLRITEVVE